MREKNNDWMWVVISAVVFVGAGAWIYDVWSGVGSNAHDDARNLALILGGFIGIPLAVWRSKVAQTQAVTALKQANLAERDHSTGRLIKAAELVKSDKLHERLVGIHTLAQLAETARKGGRKQDDEELDLIRLMLTEFIRTPPYAKEQAARQEQFERERKIDWTITAKYLPITCPDLHEAIKTLLKFDPPKQKAKVFWDEDRYHDLTSADLRYLSLGNVNFENVDFDNADFRHASLNEAEFHHTSFKFAKFQHASLGRAKFHYASLLFANFDYANLSDADFSIETDASGADFSKAWCWADAKPSGLPDDCLAKIEETF